MEESINKKFGKRIVELRNELNISQEELSLRCDLSRAYISYMERGKKSPTLKTIERLANGLNTDISTIFRNL
jgi:transcriptional regulator with XRE-family HTH domain